MYAVWFEDVADVFQMKMDHITDRLPGVIAIHDDICVYGKTQEQTRQTPSSTSHDSKSQRSSL